MLTIFLSYASDDRERVRPIVEALTEAGMSVWWDRRIPPGSSYPDVIAEQLSRSDTVVVVWTRDSVKSEWVLEEAEQGKLRGTLCPVLLDEVDLPLGFTRRHAIDFREWNQRSNAPEITELVEALGAPPPPPPPQRGWRKVLGRLSRRRTMIAGGVAAVALLSGAAAIIALADGGSDGPTTTEGGPTTTEGGPTTTEGGPTTTVLFEDDFSNDEYGWPDDPQEQVGGRYADGAYLIHAEAILPKESNRMGVIVSPANAPSAENVRIDVEAAVTGGSVVTLGDGYAYGIVCRAGDDFNDLYRFTFWPEGPAVHIQKRLDGEWQLLKEKELLGNGVARELQAQCVTKPGGAVELDFVVNGERTKASDKEETLETGAFGLNALLGPGIEPGETLDVQFDDIAVSQPKVGRR